MIQETTRPIAIFEGYVDGEPHVRWLDRSRMPQAGDRLCVAAVGQPSVLTDEQIIEICDQEGLGKCLGLAVGRAIERAAIAARLASKSQAAQPSIDTPEFMDALCKFYEQCSCEDFDKPAYDAARKAVLAHLASRSQAAPVAEAVPDLTVWYGAMPESNGKSNFTATLMRKGASMFDTDSYTFARSEYPERVRYEADSMRYLIGELSERPDILAYDADKHSGYAAPAAQAVQAVPEAVPEGWADSADELVRDLYNFEKGRHFAVRLEKLIAIAPTAQAVTQQAAPEGKVPGISHPTTYADLARITPLQLWHRWVPQDRSITAREAFIAARNIPFVGIGLVTQQAAKAEPVAKVVETDMDISVIDAILPIGTKLYLAPTTSTVSAPEEVRLAAYDPNIRWARQRVRLTLKQWDYTATLETTVGGNCQGFEIFDSAISNAWEALPTRDEDVAYVTLTRTNGDELECEDDELNGEDWLKQLVVGIEIVGQEPERTANKGEAA